MKKIVQKVDLCVVQDNALAQVYLDRKERPAVKTLVVIDQVVPPNSPAVSGMQKALREKAEQEGSACYYGTGMCGQLLAGELLQPGQTAVVCDKAALAAGGAGGQVFCANAEQLAEVLETGSITLEAGAEDTQKSILLKGRLPEDLSAKDLALSLAADPALEEIKGCHVQLLLEEALQEQLDEADCMVLCAVLAQAGAASARVKIITSEKTYEQSGEQSREQNNKRNNEQNNEQNSAQRNECAAEQEMTPAVVFCADQTRELAVLPESYKEYIALDDLSPVPVKSVFIGGTAGGQLKDLELAASMLRGRKTAYGLRLIVAPVDARTYIAAATAGYLAAIMEAGGLVINHCGNPAVQGRIGKDEVMVSNDLENKKGYAGFDSSKTYITSTRAAVEAALLGSLGRMEALQEETEVEDSSRSLTFTGRCWRFGDDIDTDIIIPTQHLNYETMDEIKIHAFEPLRPELAAQLREGDIIVAGSNFGCGSSREQAAEVLAANGIHCVIARSFARIFFRNAINNGILLLECADLHDHVEEGDMVTVELDKQQVTANGATYAIPAIPENLYHIIMDGGLVKSIEKKVEKGLL